MDNHFSQLVYKKSRLAQFSVSKSLQLKSFVLLQLHITRD